MSRLHYNPKEYQPLGTEHIREHKRCALWSSMGSGKGVMTLTALSELEFTEDVFPALALGPKRVARDVWPTECDKWEHLKHLHCVPVIGNPEQRRHALSIDSPIYSVNYENVPWLVEHYGERWPFKTVIADEARKLHGFRGGYRTHPKTGKVYLQGAGGARSRALGTVTHHGRIERFIELTGAPAPAGLQGLWGQLWYLDAGERLGRTYEGFTQRFFRSSYDGFGLEPLAGAEAEIHERIKDICLTIDVADYWDLKEPIVNNIYVDLPPAAMALYRDMEKHMFAEFEGRTVEAFGAAARTQKCLQFANGAVYVDPAADSDSHPSSKEWRVVHEAKMEALDSCIEEANGAPMLIAYTFRSDLARIMKAYPGAVDMSTQKGERAFKAGEVQLGVCHPASLGHGVDELQNVCNITTHFGHDWSEDNYSQLNARTGEIRQQQAGFDRPVYVNHILARNTLDEDVLARRGTRRTVQETLLNAAKRRKA